MHSLLLHPRTPSDPSDQHREAVAVNTEAIFQTPKEYGKGRMTRPSAISSLEKVVKALCHTTQRPTSITDLMKRVLQLDPNQRISPCAMLEHPFIYQDRPAQLVQPKNGCPEPSVEHPNSCSDEPSVPP
ncbi:hypothetical protein NHX12_031594 [Muraenolepis orangiensis]|uniref:Uncharacterized protein n=1 Tax=Muraenolepis orangiensis TaxID=630683 RepID=A0A9Q0E5X0_9TELE|nr:hypothetical protein NHX12_031594 [Muraenolepis orangiensis]